MYNINYIGLLPYIFKTHLGKGLNGTWQHIRQARHSELVVHQVNVHRRQLVAKARRVVPRRHRGKGKRFWRTNETHQLFCFPFWSKVRFVTNVLNQLGFWLCGFQGWCPLVSGPAILVNVLDHCLRFLTPWCLHVPYPLAPTFQFPTVQLWDGIAVGEEDMTFRSVAAIHRHPPVHTVYLRYQKNQW